MKREILEKEDREFREEDWRDETLFAWLMFIETSLFMFAFLLLLSVPVKLLYPETKIFR